MGRASALAVVAVLLAVAAIADTGSVAAAPPWIQPGVTAVEALPKSARVILADQAILSAPYASASRRGSAARDARLPVFSIRAGAGCPGGWIGVGPSAWICGDGVELTDDGAIKPREHTYGEAADGLPFKYYFIGPEGSNAYRRLDRADVGVPDMELQPGFSVAITAERLIDGAHYGRTNHALWVPMRELVTVHPSVFQGEEVHGLTGGVFPFAWIATDKAHIYTKPIAGTPSTVTRARFDKVAVLDEVKSFSTRFLRIGDSEYIAAKDARRPTLAAPPSEVDVAVGERWIDVDLATQTLVAYEGARPVFATLVSTGKGKEGTPQATPKGTFRVWAKLLTADMDNLEDEEATHTYRMEDVPWVQYFAKGVALHGAYWHRSFGNVRSHGCVNLTPLDAQRLFWWTGPHLPAGWTAVIPSAHEPGVLVRVR